MHTLLSIFFNTLSCFVLMHLLIFTLPRPSTHRPLDTPAAVQLKEMLQTAAGCDHGPLYLFAHHPPAYSRSSPVAVAGMGATADSSSLTGYESPSTTGTSASSASDDDRDDAPYLEPLSSWSYNDNTPSATPTSSPSFLSPLPSIESLFPLVVQLLLIYRQLGYSHGRPTPRL